MRCRIQWTAVFGLLVAQVMRVSAQSSLNLMFVLDKSLSIGLGDEHCEQVSQQRCWPLAVELVQEVTSFFEAKLNYGQEDQDSGLCVSVMTVSCDKGSPITKYLTQGCSTYKDEVDGAIYRLDKLMEPHGGTCPSEAFETSSRIMEKLQAVRPVSLVLYLTDTDVDETDSEVAKTAFNNLKETEGATVKTYLVGRKWSAEKKAEVIQDLESFDVEEELGKVSYGKNSGGGGNELGQTSSIEDATGLSVGAIAGIAVACLAAVVALYVVSKKKKDEIYDLI